MQGKQLTIWFFADEEGNKFVDINADGELMVRLNTLAAHKLAENLQRAVLNVDKITFGDKSKGQEAGE